MIPAKPEAVLPQRATDLQHLMHVPQPAHPARAPAGCHGCTACYLRQPRLLRRGRESETSQCWLRTANKCASHASVKSEHAVSAKITGSHTWRCRKVEIATERGKAAAFGYKATVLLVSASKRFRGGVRPCKGGIDCGNSQTASFVPKHCPACLQNKNKIKAEAGDGLRFCEINRK